MGVAGVIVGLFLALSLSISWIAGDKEKAKLEKQIVSEKSVQTSLERDITNVRRKSAEDAEKISQLTEKLQTETTERQRLERELEFEQRQKRIAEEQGISPDIEKIRQRIKEDIEAKSKEDIEKLEAKLSASEAARKKAEEAWAQAEVKAGRAKELEEQLKKEVEARQAAEESAKKRTAEDAEKISQLTEKLQTETTQKERSQRELESEKNLRKMAEEQGISPDMEKIRQRIKEDIEAKSKQDIERLEVSLIASEAARKKAEETSAQAELKAGKAKELEEQLKKEIEARQAAEESAKKYMAELTALNEKARTGELVAKSGAKESAAAQVEAPKVEAPPDRAEEVKQRLANLENRLQTLKVDKKIIDERLAEAMVAVVKIEESSQKVESALKAGTDKGAEAGADIETLRQARENMRLAMEKVKGAIQNSMEAETKMVLAEASQTTDVMGKMFMDPQLRAQALALSKTTREKTAMDAAELHEESLTVLNRKIEELNTLAKSVLKESGVSDKTSEKVTDALAKTPFEIYKVQKGDTLSSIAAKTEIYGKAYMWPLLYKYNFLYVDSPDYIKPDTVLLVRREASKKEVRDAIRKTNKRGPWTGEKKHIKDWILDWLK